MNNSFTAPNFISPAGKAWKNYVQILVMAVLVFNMSLSGVFFVVEPANACHGDIIIDKVTVPSGSQQSFSFTKSKANTSSWDGNFDLSDEDDPLSLPYSSSGSYTITETAESGWQLTDITCTDRYTYVVDLENRSVTINVNGNGDITCTFTNTEEVPETGTITIVKDSVPDDLQPFSFNGDLDVFTLTDDGTPANSQTFSDLSVGSYAVNEDLVSGWDLTGVTCEGGNYDPNSSGVVIALEADEHITCTFTNEKQTEEPVIIKAYKVVCEAEEYLPDWGTAGAEKPDRVDSGTAAEYVLDNPHCWLETDWAFEWGFNGEAQKQLGNHIGPAPAGTGWNAFNTVTGENSVDYAEARISDLGDSNKLWVRENLKAGYVPFINPPGDLQEPYSAELYCETDILNYDNYDWIKNPAYGETYFCVAFNAIEEPEPGTLIVIKEVVGGTAVSSEWTMEIVGVDTFPGSADGTSREVVGGNMYQVLESNGSSDYSLSYDTINSDCGETGLVSVPSGETRTCILTNTYSPEPPGTLIVIKEVVGGTAVSSEWTMEIVGVDTFPGSADGTSREVVGGNMYQVLESNGPSNYILNYDTINSDCGETGLVSVPSGETKTCILTNTYDPQCDSSITGMKYNANTMVGLEDWEIKLINQDDGAHTTAQTDVDGNYIFSDLCAGVYTVQEINQEGWVQVAPLDPGFYTVELGDGSVVENKDFGNVPEEGDLIVCKVDDEDGLIETENDQSPVGDWAFTVAYGVDESVTAFTDQETGCVTFSNLPIGEVTVSEDEVDGWLFVSPDNGILQANVQLNETTTVYFYNTRYGDQGTICGYKYNDEDNNPETVNTLGIADWTMELSGTQECAEGNEWADSVIFYEPGTRKDGSPVETGNDDPNKALGEAQYDDTSNFVSLGFGGTLILGFDNIIKNGENADLEIVETSYNNPDPATYPEKVRVYASRTGADGTWVDLGVGTLDASFDLGSLDWAKYLKLVDESDPADFVNDTDDGYNVDGVKALHCGSDWVSLESTLTGSEGRYCFYGLERGLYRVNEVLIEGWQNTTPLFGEVMVSSADLNPEFDFNNYKPSTPPEPYCGDGILQDGEQCDDGNNVSGDGCSATCTTEGGGGGGGHIYLQILDIEAYCISETEVEVNWRTNKTATSWVVYGMDSDDIEDATSTETTTESRMHTVIISDLTAGTDYFFNPYSSTGYDTDNEQITFNTDDCVKVLGEEGEPILVITKSVSQEFVNPGDKDIQYTIEVTNNGNLTAFEVVLTDTLPDGFVYVDHEGKVREWSLNDMHPGDKKLIAYKVNVGDEVVPGNYINVAEVRAINHGSVMAEAEVENRDVIVLAVTGFSLAELIYFLLFIVCALGLSSILQRYKA